MKKYFAGLVICFAIASGAAHTAPLDDMRAAIAAASRQNAFAGYSLSAMRAYAATKSGLILAKSEYLGGLLGKPAAQSVFVSLGWPRLAGSGKMDLYQSQKNGVPDGIIIMVYYDAADNASEIYVLNDTLP